VSFGSGPVSFTVSYEPASSIGVAAYTVGPDLFNPLSAGATAMKSTPTYDPITHQFMGARAAIYTWYDYCLTAGPFSNRFRVTANDGLQVWDLGLVSFILNP